MPIKKSFFTIFIGSIFLLSISFPILAQNKLTINISLKKKYDIESILSSLKRLEWVPSYYRYGRLKVDSCDMQIRVWDINHDGIFDMKDANHGANLSLDRNHDGKFWGSSEHVSGLGIIEICNRSFLLDSLSSDGSFARLIETDLNIPRVGQKVPAISLTTTEGETINLNDLKSKITVLCFWASWCKPCVEKFPILKEIAMDFKADIDVIAINVDYASRMNIARKVIEAYQLPWPHVMSGKGNYDPVWKMFGSMDENGNALGIPLYVLIDSESIIQYAGAGGNKLSELRKKIEQIVNKK